MDSSTLNCLVIAVMYLVKHLLTEHPVFHSLTQFEVSNWTDNDFVVFFDEVSLWLSCIE